MQGVLAKESQLSTGWELLGRSQVPECREPCLTLSYQLPIEVSEPLPEISEDLVLEVFAAGVPSTVPVEMRDLLVHGK